jgi:hypothetical protein
MPTKFIKSITVFCFFVVAIQLQAQISILSSDFPRKGDTVRYSTLASISNYRETGANFLWDFSGLVPQSQILIRHLDPDSADALTQSLFGSIVTPRYRASYYLPAQELPISTLSSFFDLPVDQIYRFFRVTNEEVTAVGLSISALDLGIGKRADTIEVAYKFPMEYGQFFNSKGYVDLDLSAVAPFALRQYRDRISEVDGWGNIITPYGSFPCLRIHHIINELDSFYVDFGEGPVWYPLELPTIHEYEWWANDQKGPILKVVASELFGILFPTQIIYRDVFRLSLNLSLDAELLTETSLYPNPTNDFLHINSALQYSKIEIHSMSGKLLYQNDFALEPIDVRGLESGAYFVRIINGSTVQTMKFVKQ